MMFVEDKNNTYLVGPVQIILSLSRKVREALPSVYLSSVEGQIDILLSLLEGLCLVHWNRT